MSVTELAEGKLRLDRPAPHVARLTIDSPAKRNALDHDILDAIASTVRGLDGHLHLHRLEDHHGVALLDRVAHLDLDLPHGARDVGLHVRHVPLLFAQIAGSPTIVARPPVEPGGPNFLPPVDVG